MSNKDNKDNNMELIITDQVIELPLTQITENPWNPHLSSTPELKLIADSISALGQIVPILVVRVDKELEWEGVKIDLDTPYMLVDGAQRYKALTKLFAEGDNNALLARAIIIGNMSDYEPWEIAEIGQAANHARAKTEDDIKTGKLITEITKYRNIDDYSKIVGQRQDYLTRTMDLLKARKVTEDLAAARALPSAKPALIPPQNSNRGYHTVSLPFESSEDVKQFEDLIALLPEAGKSYRGLERSYKLLAILKDYFVSDEEIIADTDMDKE